MAGKKRVRTLYRVSTKSQLEEDDIPMQRNACVNYVKSHPDWRLDGKEYIEKGVSGYKFSASERDVIQDIKNDAERGDFDILLVFMFDRIGRKQYETPLIMKTLDSLGIELWSVKEGQQKFEDHSDDLINFIRFWQSDGESKKTSMRVNEDHTQMVLNGEFRGGNKTYGYDLVPSGQKNKNSRDLLQPVVNEEESKVIKLIFDLVYKQGFGGNRIAQHLNEKGILTSKGKKWNASAINYILRNPVYKGYMVYGKTKSNENGKLRTQSRDNWVISNEKNEDLAIIPENIWDEVQKIRSSRSPQNVKDKNVKTIQVSKSPLLFVGMINCAHCGSPLTTTYNTKTYTKKDGSIIKHRQAKYRCSGKALNKTNCDGQTIYSQKKVENIVLKKLDEFLSHFEKENLDEEVEEKKKGSKDNEEKELENVKRNLTEQNNELSKLEEEVTKSLVGDSHFKPEILNSLIEKKQNEITVLENRKETLEDSVSDKNQNYEEMQKLKRYIPVWKDEFDKMNFQTKKMLLSQAIDQIYVGKEEIHVDFNLHVGEFLETILK